MKYSFTRFFIWLGVELMGLAGILGAYIAGCSIEHVSIVNAGLSAPIVLCALWTIASFFVAAELDKN